MIDIVCATRLNEDDFWEKSALGLSLRRMAHDQRLVAYLVCENQRGLPDIYNDCVDENTGNDIVVFIHDDVWIEDYYFADRIIDGLRSYDVIGVAGNRRRVPYQPAWPFVDLSFNWDERSNLSGALGHGENPCGAVSFFSHPPADCELLDGVLLASTKSKLKAKNVRFDPRFAFHFYDMDFCRTARRNSLRLGTWPIAMTHRSGGAFNSPTWYENFYRYIAKWED